MFQVTTVAGPVMAYKNVVWPLSCSLVSAISESMGSWLRSELAGFMLSLGRECCTMSKKEKRVGSAGRFGARYGRVARRRVAEIEDEMRNATVDDDPVKRIGTGIWVNENTGEKFTGGAYRPETPAGKTVTRSIRAALEEGDE